MNKNTYINHLDYYVPKHTMTIKDLANGLSEEKLIFFGGLDDFVEFSKEFLTDNVSIEEHLTLEEMLFQMVQENIESNHVDKKKTRYIILAIEDNQSLKNFGHYLQYKLELIYANVINISGNYCANIDVALGMGTSILGNNSASEVLIITGNKIQILNDRIIGTYGILGDAVGMMVLSNQKKDDAIEIISQYNITKGELHQIDFTKDNTVLLYESYIACVKGVLSKSELASQDIKQVFLHNANTMLIEEALLACDIDIDLVYTDNKSSYGHLDTVDLILNIKHYAEKAKPSPQYILSLSSGITGTYCATLYKI